MGSEEALVEIVTVANEPTSGVLDGVSVVICVAGMRVGEGE